MNHPLLVINTTEPLRISGKMRLLILAVVLAALSVLLYRVVLWNLAVSVLHREGSSHGVFVPFISGIFLWVKWDKIRNSRVDFAPAPGILMAAAGLLTLYLSADTTEVALPALSFLLVAAGLVVGLFGTGVFKEAGFPLLFLVTMIPLPEPAYAKIADWMKTMNTAGSLWVLKLLGVPFHREAYNICLPDTTLLVGPSCSGIRYLLSFFVFGLAYAFLFKQGIKSRTLVVLATIPISIIGGILRLSAIFLAAYYIGPFMADHLPHVLISWSVFALVLVGAMSVDHYCLSGKKVGMNR